MDAAAGLAAFPRATAFGPNERHKYRLQFIANMENPVWTERHTKIAKRLEERLKDGGPAIIYDSFEDYKRGMHAGQDSSGSNR